jgi:pimeloyl-ACP methyl ester carboxylesterase
MGGGDRFAAINGLKLHYTEHGPRDAQAIVCPHGGGGNAHAWDLFAPYLGALTDQLLRRGMRVDIARGDSFDQL